MIPKDHIKTSVVIVTHNRAGIINLCLGSIERQTIPPHETIVIDSSDDDETERILKNRTITYLHTERRVYQPQARNLSLRIANGDVIAFVDDDVFCTPEWLKNIVKGYSGTNVAGVAGPVIRCNERLEPLEKVNVSEKNQNFFTSWGDIHAAGAWMPERPTRTKLMFGCNMSFLKSKLKEVGGFDEYYGKGGAYREETDPQIALIKRGYEFNYMPKAVVYHIQYSSGGIRSDGQSDYYYWCGKYHKYLADKYFPKWSSRLSWVFWSFDPPCLWLCVATAMLRRNRAITKWAKGLWL